MGLARQLSGGTRLDQLCDAIAPSYTRTIMNTLAELPRPWKGLTEGPESWRNPAFKPTKSWAQIAAEYPECHYARDQVEAQAAAAARRTR
jgi:hypothetical protein